MLERNQNAGSPGAASMASSVGPPKALGESKQLTNCQNKEDSSIVKPSTEILADIPAELSTELKRLEEMFIVDRQKLKLITQHLVEELEKGETFHNEDFR